MLYNLYEAQHTALTPYRYLAELIRGWYGNPFSPLHYLPLASRLAAGSDLFLRVTERYEKPEWNLPEVEVEVAHRFGELALAHGKRRALVGQCFAPLAQGSAGGGLGFGGRARWLSRWLDRWLDR